MIKKHKHRKDQNQVLKLPKNYKKIDSEELNSSIDAEEDGDSGSDYDKSTLVKSHNGGETNRSAETAKSLSVVSKITHLSSMKAVNKYEA